MSACVIGKPVKDDAALGMGGRVNRNSTQYVTLKRDTLMLSNGRMESKKQWNHMLLNDRFYHSAITSHLPFCPKPVC